MSFRLKIVQNVMGKKQTTMRATKPNPRNMHEINFVQWTGETLSILHSMKRMSNSKVFSGLEFRQNIFSIHEQKFSYYFLLYPFKIKN